MKLVEEKDIKNMDIDQYVETRTAQIVIKTWLYDKEQNVKLQLLYVLQRPFDEDYSYTDWKV